MAELERTNPRNFRLQKNFFITFAIPSLALSKVLPKYLTWVILMPEATVKRIKLYSINLNLNFHADSNFQKSKLQY